MFTTQPTVIHYYYSGCNLYIENASIPDNFSLVEIQKPLSNQNYRQLCPGVSTGVGGVGLVFFTQLNPTMYNSSNKQMCVSVCDLKKGIVDCTILTRKNYREFEGFLIKEAILHEGQILQLLLSA
jgi:hypothetical protein